MTIDNAPAIKAYCQERIRSLKRDFPEGSNRDNLVAELQQVIVLVDGLEKQAELLNKALGV